MDYTKSAQTAEATPAAGPSDLALMRTMVGQYYSYVGQTERKLALCPSGTFFDSSESSYSGVFTDSGGAWGAASESKGSGSWAIQGNQQAGTITFSYKGGKKVQVRYQATGERGCYHFDDILFCYSGAARCQ